MTEVQVLILSNYTAVISEVYGMDVEEGHPNCKLVKPYSISVKNISSDDPYEYTLTPWMEEYTAQDVIMIHSDEILTALEPNPTLMSAYNEAAERQVVIIPKRRKVKKVSPKKQEVEEKEV